MAPDRDQLCVMSRKDKETFKDYVQRWCEIAAQVSPPLDEKGDDKAVFEDVEFGLIRSDGCKYA